MWNDLPEDLLLAARNGDLNVLIGAGASMDAGLPGWSHLLASLAMSLPGRRRSQVERLLAAERLLQAAQLLKDDLTPAQLRNGLRSALGRQQDPSPIHEEIWSLRPPLVITTNFDELLETAFARKMKQAPQVLLGIDSGRQNLRPGATIVKLHGDLSSPESLVLARNDYFELMQRALTQPHSIWSELVRRPCLAVGYSLRDPDLQLLLHWSETELRGLAQTVYLLLPEQPEEEIQLLRSFGIVVPLEYPASRGHRTAVLALLERLANERAQAAFAADTSPARLALLAQSHNEIGAIFHDLNNHLLTVRGGLEIFLRGLEPGSEAEDKDRKLLDMAREAAERAGKLVAEAQDLIVAERQRMSPSSWTKCREALEATLEQNPRYASVQHQLGGDLESEMPVGPRLYTRLVRILVDNSIEALADRDGGLVEVQIHPEEGGSRTFLTTTIRDNGPGIAPEIARRLFTPGASSKGARRGHGLFIVHTVAHEVGGHLAVTSSQDKGTVVGLRLPIRLEASTSAPAHKGRPAISLPRFERELEVWVVDDELVIVQMLTAMLEHQGCRITTCTTAAETLRNLEECERAPDILLVDMVMPDMSGYDLARRARERFPRLPVLFMSGYISDAEILRQPSSRFLQKPFETEQLLEAVRDLTAGAIETQQRLFPPLSQPTG